MTVVGLGKLRPDSQFGQKFERWMSKDTRKAQKREIVIKLDDHLDWKTMKLQGEIYQERTLLYHTR